MAIIWNKIIPRWGGTTIEPPEAKKDEGYLIDDVPSASWENWLRKGTYEALDETRDVIENIDSQLAQDVLNLNTHTNNTTDAHGATSNPTGNTIASRDSSGRLFTEPMRALTAVGQTLNLSSRGTSVYGNNPTVTLGRVLGGADSVTETCLLVTKRSTSATNATTGLYLLVRQSDASYVMPVINDPDITIVINAGLNVTVSTSGIALIQCDMIAIGG